MASIVHHTAHGLIAGDAFYFGNLIPSDCGAAEGQVYYVLAAGLTANDFEFSETAGGTAFVLTHDVDSGIVSKVAVYTPITDPTDAMAPPTAPTAPGSVVLSSAAVLAPDGTTVARLDITIVQPTSATLRHTIVTVTGGSNAVKVVIPVGQTTGSIASVVPGLSYTGTAIAYDTFGNASGATASVAHVAVGDTTAPAQITGAVAVGGILGVTVAWGPSASADLANYQLQIDDNSGFTTPDVYTIKTNILIINPLAAGTWYARIRAVDLSGNAGTYSATVNADSRKVATADVGAGAITHTEISDGEITTPKLAANSVTADKVSIGSRGRSPLIANPGFEDGTPSSGAVLGWSVGGVANIVAAGGFTGANRVDLACVTSPFDASIASNRFPCHAGDTVYVSVMARAVAGSANLTLQINWYNISNVIITNVTVFDYISGGSTVWTETHGTLVAPPNTAYAQVQIYSDVAGTTIGVDEVIVRTSDSIVTADGNVQIDASGITINNGALIIKDEFAKTSMIASGFSGNWADFIATGLYNGRFLSGAAGGIASGRTANLPYWTLANITGTPFAVFVANGGVDVSFNALTDKKSFTSDQVQVHPAAVYQANFTISTVKASATMFLILATFIDWFKADGTASAITATTTLDQNSFSGTLAATLINTLLPVRPPSDARFAKLRFTIEESNIGAHNSGNKLTLLSSSFKEVANTTVGIGAAFPVTPAPLTYDRFFHTGKQMEFFWDGTRWLSTHVFTASPVNGVAIPLTATAGTGSMRWNFDKQGGTDIWLVATHCSFFISAGTALSGSHSWISLTLTAQPGNTAKGGILTINSGASGAWRETSSAIGALLGTTNFHIDSGWTKTGTPGNMSVYETISYRVVAT